MFYGFSFQKRFFYDIMLWENFETGKDAVVYDFVTIDGFDMPNATT